MKRIKLIFVLTALGLLLMSGCAQMENDVQLTRRIFNGLCRGNQGVQSLIDWETLKAVEMDVGQPYSMLRNEKEKADYKKAFFYNFAFSFKAAGGRTTNFFNWRVKSKDALSSVVAADTAGQGKVILFTLTHRNNKRKLTAINWE
jgi:hypothetical protein